MEPVLDDFNENEAMEATDTDQEPQTDTDRTDGEETTTTPSQSRSSSIRPQPLISFIDDDVDLFDGYSFKGQHSVLIDDDEDEGDETDSLSGEEEGGESIQEEDEDNLSILERLEEEAGKLDRLLLMEMSMQMDIVIMMFQLGRRAVWWMIMGLSLRLLATMHVRLLRKHNEGQSTQTMTNDGSHQLKR